MKHKTRLFFSPFLLLVFVLQTSGWVGTCAPCEAEEMSHDKMPQMASCHMGDFTTADIQGITIEAVSCDCCKVLKCADVASYPEEQVVIAEFTAQYSHAAIVRTKTGFNNQPFSSVTLPGKYKQKPSSSPLFILHRSLLI